MTREHEDGQFMREALDLAVRALGRTAPNPAVGAVVVRDGHVVGRGWTRPPGGAHAEVVALAEAGADAVGATLYVTLEPCSHHGRTPPCTEAIIAAGITRCVVAVTDPFPLVAGSGISFLRQSGLAVEIGPEAREATDLNAGFFTRVRTGRPCVVAKYAMTLDGRIATRTGHSRWVTGEEARQAVHLMRDRVDAIAVGAGTVTADDPTLTTRLPVQLSGDGGPHHPRRVVIDGHGSSPLTAHLFNPELPGQTLVATTGAARPEWLAALARRGIARERCGDGPCVDLPLLLDLLGARGVNTLLVEGGGRLHGAFFDAGLVDRVSAFIAPVLVGGAESPGPVSGHGVATLAEAVRLKDVRVRRYGEDVLVEGEVVKPAAGEVG
ncbi:MAG: bifunctional diaminohydroxyphosphoribosylaminopyrimidine deaminase/5-amino-6-(5-phosphoribosylamino)uracil reductase RibD [Thermomicrobiales bacterium]